MFLFMLAQTNPPAPQTTEGAYLAIIVAVAASAPFILKALIGLLTAITKRIQSGTDVKGEELAIITWYKTELATRTSERDISLAHGDRQRVTLQSYEDLEKQTSNKQNRIDELVAVNKELEISLQNCLDSKSVSPPAPAPTSPREDLDQTDL